MFSFLISICLRFNLHQSMKKNCTVLLKWYSDLQNKLAVLQENEYLPLAVVFFAKMKIHRIEFTLRFWIVPSNNDIKDLIPGFLVENVLVVSKSSSTIYIGFDSSSIYISWNTFFISIPLQHEYVTIWIAFTNIDPFIHF